MPRVLLATFQLYPQGEPPGDLLTPALAERGVDARWAVWDDPAVDWAAADLVVVRSTWDYHRRLPDFLAWARRVEQVSPLLNGADVFAWNAHKSYLVELAGLVPTVPTEVLDDATLVTGLGAALAEHGTVVLKPCTGASGVGVVVAASPTDQRLACLTPAPWVVQPLVGSVRTTGERSVYVLGGRAVSQVAKLPDPAGEEIRIHSMYGGASRGVPLDPAAGALAETVVAAAAAHLGADLAYARVDLMVLGGDWVLSELELIEPGLSLHVAPENAGHFADLVAARTATP